MPRFARLGADTRIPVPTAEFHDPNASISHNLTIERDGLVCEICGDVHDLDAKLFGWRREVWS